MKKIALVLLVLLAGCAGMVRQADLDAWRGVPVEALDTHSFFLTLPMARTISNSGIEIRNYSNGADFANCFSSGGASQSSKYVNASAFTTCSNNRIVCNNIFYIKDARVLEYAPTGRCYTNDSVRPQKRYVELQRKL